MQQGGIVHLYSKLCDAVTLLGEKLLEVADFLWGESALTLTAGILFLQYIIVVLKKL